MAGSGSHMKKSCACCKRYLDHLGGKMNCFLRRMTADYKHSIIMPNRFANRFRGYIQGTIKLESPNGILYVVEVTEHMNKTVLECGWEAFVDAHHLEENDSLLFQYIENSHFKVLILDSDDCEKVFSCAGIRNTSCIKERSAYSDGISSSSRDDTTESSGSKRIAGCQRGNSSHRRKTAKIAALTSSSSEESGDDNPSECESLESDGLQATRGPDYVLLRGSCLAETQKENVIALIQEIQPEITVFLAVMQKCHVQPRNPSLNITKEYAVVHFPRESATVTLQMPGKSKKWHPRFYKYNTSDRSLYMLRGHWLDFVCDNRVQDGDICIFVPAKGGKRFTFTVHLLRQETTHSRAGTGFQRVRSSYGRTNTKIGSAVHMKEEPVDEENISSESNRHGVSHESQEREDSQGPSEPPYILAFKGYLSLLQKKIVEDKVQSFQSEAPLYVAIMNKTNIGVGQQCTMEFGAQYVTAVHLPDRSRTMILESIGKKWDTKMQIWSGKRRVLVGGWRKFVHDNHLRVGDICLFELNKNEWKLTMTVHIIFNEQC